MALALSKSTSQAQPAGKWLSVEAVAMQLGKSERQVRRLAAEEWSQRGLAKCEQSGPNRSAWLVNEFAHPALASIKFADQMSAEFDFSRLTDDQRKQLVERQSILRAWLNAKKSGFAENKTERQITSEFLQTLSLTRQLKVTRSTLFAWDRAHQASGLAGLVDGRWKTTEQTTEASNDPFFALFDSMYLKPQSPSITVIHAAAVHLASERGIPARSYKQTQRHVAKIPEAVRVRMRQGEKAFNDRFAPYIERDYASLPVNHLWCSDHHQFDVMVLHEGKLIRPWLTSFEDLRSRKIVGWAVYAHAPNSGTILRAFRQGVAACGVPAFCYVDNGKDYDSRALQGITKKQRQAGFELSKDELAIMGGAFGNLGIEVTHSWPYNARAKPIERFHGTVCARFSKLFDTYCGKDVLSKPDGLQDRLEAGIAPTLDEFIEAFGEWVACDYNGRAHGGDAMDGKTPDQVFEELGSEKKVVPADVLDFATWPKFGPVTIGRQGVTWQGVHYGRSSYKLSSMFGQRVMLTINPDDIGYVLVSDTQGRFLTRAEGNQKLSFTGSQQELREAISEQRTIRKERKKYRGRMPRLAEDPLRAIARRKAESAAKRNDVPVVLKHHRTAFDDQHQQIADAIRPAERIAVGAESFQGVSLVEIMQAREKKMQCDDEQEYSWDVISRAMRERRAANEE